MNVRKGAEPLRGCENLPIVSRMGRPLPILALTCAALLAVPSASALAQSGGSVDPVTGLPAAPAPATGGSAPTGGTAPTGVPSPASSANGGNGYGKRFDIPPVVKSFSASPRSVVFGGAATTLRFRVTSVNAKHVRLVLSAKRAGGGTVKVNLGSRTTNRTLKVRWARKGIAAGSYTLSLTAVDTKGKALARAARAGLTVRAKPKPKPSPAPSPGPGSGDGVFPVAGPHSWNDGFGVDRGDHKHMGQDLPATEGTPLVAVRSSSVFATGYSAGGAGEYVVLYDSGTNRSYVYMHLVRHSTTVSDGQSVRAGQRLGSVGATGDATGPHLHFELWLGKWFDGGHAVDPAPFLHSLE
jgi:murein DD-endopeptidase MepM/ murein hydrolase activator NlpD